MTGREVATLCHVRRIARPRDWADNRVSRGAGPRAARREGRRSGGHGPEPRGDPDESDPRRAVGPCAGELVNRSVGTTHNLKHIRRVMDIAGWTLPQYARQCTGRAHMGQVHRARSRTSGGAERWRHDRLEFACGDGEYIQIAFVLDCHDRECLA